MKIEIVFDELHWTVGSSVHMVHEREEGREGAREADRALPKG